MNWGLRAHTSRASEQARWPLCSYREATECMRPLLPRLSVPNSPGQTVQVSWRAGKPSLHPELLQGSCGPGMVPDSAALG